MSNVNVIFTAEDSSTRFPSMASLRAAHSQLLASRSDTNLAAAFLADVHAFIARAQASGALIDSDDDRWAAQGLLDYWSNMLYRAGYQLDDVTLAEFDPELAPDLDETLCPYLGLEAFHESTNGLFFGRQRVVEELLNRLSENRLLAVVGASGSGKSSLVLAGLVSALKAGALNGSEKWTYYLPVVPGSEPLVSLARSIGQSGISSLASTQVDPNGFLQSEDHLTRLIGKGEKTPTVIVVDQFEEIFTLCPDHRVRQAFVANLLHLIQTPGADNAVVLTMRSDFETNIVRLPMLQALFERSTVRVAPLNAAELRDAIEKPAELVGLKFEEGVVEALINDILGEPAALPLLQFTLLKLWETREHNRVTKEAYRRLGGGLLALARSADEFYMKLIPEEQVTVKRILLRMVRPSEGLEVTSSRVPLRALYKGSDASDRIDRVLDKLVQRRLVRITEADSPDAQVEVAHEALVRNWPRLVEWLEEERAAINMRRRLEEKSAEWMRLGQGKSGLLDEVQLLEAKRWLESSEAAYLGFDESLPALVEASANALDEAKRKEHRAYALMRNLAIALALMTLIAVTAAAYAIVKARSAQQNQEKAQNAQALAEEKSQSAVAAMQLAESRAEEVAKAKEQETKAKEQETKLRKQAEDAAKLAKAKAQELVATEERLRWAEKSQAEAVFDERLRQEKYKMLDSQANEASQRGDYEEAIRRYKEVLKDQRQDKDKLGEAAALTNIGLAYYSWNKFDEAAEELKEALGLRREQSPVDNFDVANASNALANVYFSQKRYDEAEKLYKQAVDAYKNRLGPNNSRTAIVIRNLAMAQFQKGDLEQAKTGFDEALAIQTTDPESNALAIARTYTEIGRFYEAGKEYTKAEQLYKQALDIREKKEGRVSSEAAFVLRDFGSLSEKQGKYSEAEQYFKESLAIISETSAASSTTLAGSLSYLASIYVDQARYAEALSLSQQALAINKLKYGEHHRAIAINFNDTGLIYFNQGDYDKSIPYYEQALKIFTDSKVPDHREIANSTCHLASSIRNQGRFKEAEKLYEQALEEYKNAPGLSRRQRANGLNGLARTYYKEGPEKYLEAEKLFLEARETYSSYLATDNLRLLVNSIWLAELYRDQGKNDVAEPLFKAALERLERTVGRSHPYFVEALDNYAVLFTKDES